jgi:hypothetical protein
MLAQLLHTELAEAYMLPRLLYVKTDCFDKPGCQGKRGLPSKVMSRVPH